MPLSLNYVASVVPFNAKSRSLNVCWTLNVSARMYYCMSAIRVLCKFFLELLHLS